MTESEQQNIKEQFKDILSNGIAPILKTAGFKKSGCNFHARAGEMDWCINIQKERWGFNDYTWQFTINIGVTWNDYTTSLFDKACDFPLESSCPIRARIGMFMGKGDYWFVLRPNQDHLPVKEQICSTITEKVLPVLNGIKCFDDAWKYIIKDSTWCESLTNLFSNKPEPKVFEISPFGFYMLCLQTEKEKEAKLFRAELEQRGANLEILDKILATYKKNLKQ